MQNEIITAVIVSYKPDKFLLEQLLLALSPQVTHIIIINNGDENDINVEGRDHSTQLSSLKTIHLNENVGIATAQNIGIKWAQEHNSDYVLLMDQDSLPNSDMVAELYSAMQRIKDSAAVGPNYIDPRAPHLSPFVLLERFKFKRIPAKADINEVVVEHLIASGCLIPIEVIDQIGNMREDLFIDYVDTEWGLRASAQGLKSYGVFSAKMQHQLGEAPLEFLGRKVAAHKPYRHYYLYRNAILLYRESYISLHWKLTLFWRLSCKFFFFSLFAPQPWKHFKMMTLGIFHGLINRSGKLQEP
jgi:rhamnosyltransferase